MHTFHSKPNKDKSTDINIIADLSQKNKIALVFGTDEIRNKSIKKLSENSDYHCDISKKNIKLELDTEIGAIASIIYKIRTT